MGPRGDGLGSSGPAPRGRRAALWRNLERATNVAILVTCAVLVAVVVRGGLAARPPDLPPGPAAGDRLEGIDGLELASREQTLLLVVSSQCRYCTESMPFYRQLLERRRKEQTQVLVASTESAAVTAAYLAGHGVQADRILEVDPGELGATPTPTLLELSRSGEILEVIVGRVPDGQVAEVATRLLSPGSTESNSEQELGTRELELQ